MTSDAVFRGVCIALAVVLGAAPYWPSVKDAAGRLIEAAKERASHLRRLVVIGLLLVAGGVFDRLLPSLRLPTVQPVSVTVEAPSVEMQERVAGVVSAMRSASPVDRAVWASVWEKAALVVEAPEGSEPVFTDTRSLRGFTVLSLDIAWRRLGGHTPGDVPGLREAVEKAMGDVVGLEVKPVTPELRRAYAEACRAIAWAGVGKG